jgi:hypothetical protein
VVGEVDGGGVKAKIERERARAAARRFSVSELQTVVLDKSYGCIPTPLGLGKCSGWHAPTLS